MKDSVEHVWWLSKTPHPKANNRKVLKPYSKDMLRLNERGLKNTQRPSGHVIRESFAEVEHGGSIPPNVFEGDSLPEDLMKFGNNAANDSYALGCKEHGMKRHPARFPAALPEFFINFLTNDQDLVMDPFAGSNTTGAVAERMNRKWLAVDRVEEYLEGSRFRFCRNRTLRRRSAMRRIRRQECPRTVRGAGRSAIVWASTSTPRRPRRTARSGR